MPGVQDLDLVARSQEVAAHAAARAGVRVEDLRELEDLRAAARIFSSIWGTGETHPVSPDLLRALAHTGNFVAGARREGQLVGASVGFLALGEDGLRLHSHITGVIPTEEGQHTGWALKQYQRAWALGRGIRTVTWTFDPLVRRNAYFNLSKLGAELTALFPNFYGRMRDAINAGDESDRGLVVWRLDAERAVAAAEGERREPDVPSLLAEGARVVLAAGEAGEPLLGPAEGEVRLCWIPPDIVGLRRRDPALGRAWRLALREALGAALAGGLRAAAFSRDGWYVLRAP